MGHKVFSRMTLQVFNNNWLNFFVFRDGFFYCGPLKGETNFFVIKNFFSFFFYNFPLNLFFFFLFHVYKKILFKKQLFDLKVKGQGPTKVITVCDTPSYGHAPIYQISLTYLERQKCYGPDKKILFKNQLFITFLSFEIGQW
jgi:hypothetical protein